jgi:hypothetical protein
MVRPIEPKKDKFSNFLEEQTRKKEKKKQKKKEKKTSEKVRID